MDELVMWLPGEHRTSLPIRVSRSTVRFVAELNPVADGHEGPQKGVMPDDGLAARS
jgi:hypothetical protein